MINVHRVDRAPFLHVYEVNFELSSMSKSTFGKFGQIRLRT